jgi:DNA-binding transcriptional LysR family regulator
VLLERAGRGVRPTDSGRLLAEHAAGLLGRAAEAETALAALQAGELGVLRLASFATAGAELLPPAVAKVRAVLPQLEISLRLAEREDALPMLRQGMLDVAVVEAHDFPAEGALQGGVVWNGLLSDPFRIVMPRGHPLARRRIISLREVAGESWVDVRCEVGCCRAATDTAFRQAGFVPHRAFEADEYWPAQGFVAAGLGVALIPAVALGILHPGVVVRRLASATQPVRQVLVAIRPALAGTVPVQAMITALQSVATQRRALRGRQ